MDNEHERRICADLAKEWGDLNQQLHRTDMVAREMIVPMQAAMSRWRDAVATHLAAFGARMTFRFDHAKLVSAPLFSVVMAIDGKREETLVFALTPGIVKVLGERHDFELPAGQQELDAYLAATVKRYYSTSRPVREDEL